MTIVVLKKLHLWKTPGKQSANYIECISYQVMVYMNVSHQAQPQLEK
jgi:hypothetical protein